MVKEMNTTTQSKDYAFVTYLAEDEEIASSNLAMFRDFGIEVFHKDNLNDGSFADYEEKIKNSSVLIPFITQNAVESGPCRRDIVLAFKYDVPILAISLERTVIDDMLLNMLGGKAPIRRY